VVQQDATFQAVMHLLEVLPPFKQDSEAPLISSTITAMLPILERGRGDHLKAQTNETLILPFSKMLMLEL